MRMRPVAPPWLHFYGRAGDCDSKRRKSDGMIIGRVIVITMAAASVAGCGGFSLDALKPTPATIQVQLGSEPPGADAKTSLGPGCKTPCSVEVAAPDSGFSVSFTLNRYQPVTIPVQVIRVAADLTLVGGTATTDPSPVFAELQPAGPPPKGEKPAAKSKKPKPAPVAQ
jgi:hypothetical protein